MQGHHGESALRRLVQLLAHLVEDLMVLVDVALYALRRHAEMMVPAIN